MERSYQVSEKAGHRVEEDRHIEHRFCKEPYKSIRKSKKIGKGLKQALHTGRYPNGQQTYEKGVHSMSSSAVQV